MSKFKRYLGFMLVFVTLAAQSRLNVAASSSDAAYDNITAIPVEYSLSVDGKSAQLWAYEINGGVYFKLRDIAMAMNGTQKQFNISWESENNEVDVFPGAYTPVGGELSTSGVSGDAFAKYTYYSMRGYYGWGNILTYIVSDNNYVKLSDLAALLKFSSSCDKEKHEAKIDISPAEDSSKETGVAIDNIALSGAGNSYALDKDGNVVILYNNGSEIAKAPVTLQPAGSSYASGQSVDRAGFYISKAKTAVAYGGQNADPVYVVTSEDMGKTWKKSELIAQNVGVNKLFVGFNSTDDGWLVICNFHGMGSEFNYIYQTFDGGKTWTQIGNPNDVYARVATGAGFSTSQIGFVSYRYDFTDFEPAILRTLDGGYTWEKLYVSLPDEYKVYNKTPLSPVFSGAEGLYPIALSNGDGYFKTVYLTSADCGVTWAYDQTRDCVLLPETKVLLTGSQKDDIFIYGDSLHENSGIYSGLYLSINGVNKYYNWKSMADSFVPELALKDMNGDGKNELVIILTADEGTEVLDSVVHVINPDDFTETEVANPLSIISERVNSSIADANGIVTILITANGQTSKMTFNEDYAHGWSEDTVKFGRIVRFAVDGALLKATVPAQVSDLVFVGDVNITYTFMNDKYVMDKIEFIPYKEFKSY